MKKKWIAIVENLNAQAVVASAWHPYLRRCLPWTGGPDEYGPS